MKITTYQFGEVEFEDSIIITFDEGIIGFENLKKYILLSEEDNLFYWLTSVDEPEIVFPLFPIRLVMTDYPDVEKHESFGIVKLAKNPGDITLNLKAPVFINQESRQGYQKIFDTDKYQMDYQLFVEN